MQNTFKKGDRVIWREWLGVVHAMSPAKVYVLFYGEDGKTVTGGCWHKRNEVAKLTEVQKWLSVVN